MVVSAFPDCLRQDYDAGLEKLAPHNPVSHYRHNEPSEDNTDAHLKRQVMGREVKVAITGGKLDFGPWELIFCGESDERRRKRELVKINGDKIKLLMSKKVKKNDNLFIFRRVTQMRCWKWNTNQKQNPPSALPNHPHYPTAK